MAHVYWIHLPYHNDVTKEGYVGVSKQVEERISYHFKSLERGLHENEHLSRAYNKYKELVHTLLVEGTEEYCYELEEKLRPERFIGWNVNKGGSAPPVNYGNAWNKGKKLSEEHKQKIGDKSYFKQFNKSEERKQLTSKTMKGKPKTEEQKRKQSDAMKGKMTGELNPSKREDVKKKLSEARKKWWAERKKSQEQ